MSTVVFNHTWNSEGKNGVVCATGQSCPEARPNTDTYSNVSKVVLDCGVYVIYTAKSTFTTPATNIDLYITVED